MREEATALYEKLEAILLKRPLDSAREESLYEVREARTNSNVPLLRLFVQFVRDSTIVLSDVRDVYEILETTTDHPEQFVTPDAVKTFATLSYAVWVLNKKNDHVNMDSLFAGILMSGERDDVLLRALLKAEPVSGEHFTRLLGEVRNGSKSLASGLL